MLFYSHRTMIADEYNKWIHDNNVLNSPESMVAFLQIRGWLNEDDILMHYHRTMKAKPTKHGRWIEDEYGIPHCSECKAINNTVYRNYCPNCGARMDEENL